MAASVRTARPTVTFAERVSVEFNPATGIAFIALDGEAAGYFVDVIASEAGTPAGLTFTKIATRECHPVAIDAGAICTCKSFKYRGYCRHAVAATRLVEDGAV